MILKFLVHFIGLLLLSACVKEFDPKFDSLGKKVVVNSLFRSDTTMYVHVGLSSAYDESPIIVDAAELWLYEDDSLIVYQNTKTGHFFSMNYIPKIEKEYKIEVLVPGFDKVSAVSSIPANAFVSDFTCKLLPGFSPDGWGHQNSEVKLVFKDSYEYENFYELHFVFGADANKTVWGLENSPMTAYMKDLSIITDSDLDYQPNQYYFTDRLFNGLIKTVELSYLGGKEYTNEGFVYKPFQAIFKSVSSEYYQFRKSWTIHQFNKNGNTQNLNDPMTLFFLGDPVKMYSNINGGLGIFAGYNRQFIPLNYIE